MKYKVFKSLQRLFAFEQLEGYKGTYKFFDRKSEDGIFFDYLHLDCLTMKCVRYAESATSFNNAWALLNSSRNRTLIEGSRVGRWADEYVCSPRIRRDCRITPRSPVFGRDFAEGVRNNAPVFRLKNSQIFSICSSIKETLITFLKS